MGTVNSGPIPGANMTSDTKNYPWRQPPKYANVNDAMDFLADKLTKFKVANGLLSMIEIGLPVYKVAQLVLMQGVGGGFWTVDFALLLAGPTTRMIELICIGFDVKYDLGIADDENDFNTGNFFTKGLDLQTPAGGFKLLNQEMDNLKQDAEESSTGGGDSSDTTQPQEAATKSGNGNLMTGGFMAMMGGQGSPAKGATK